MPRAVVCLAVLCTAPAWAAQEVPARAAQEQRALLELVINGTPAKEVLVLLREGDALVSVAALRDGGLRTVAGAREPIDGEDHVSLASLAPAVTFTVDERDLRLIVTAGPDLLGVNVRDFATGPPAELVYGSSSSAFVNYSINVVDGQRYDAFLESATSVRQALLYNTVSLRGRTAVRGLTSVTLDERGALRRWIVGDSFGHTGPLGGSTWLAGVNVAREFSIDPYFVRHPTLSVTAPVSVPSVVEIYVNGRLVTQEPVAPGLLDVRNLPVASGRNDAQVVIRDPFGGVRELATNYYLTSSVLAPGLHDYQYSVGARRHALGVDSWSYGRPAALARHRVGLTDTVTLGGRLEAASDVVSGGPLLNLRLPVGQVEAAAAFSRAPGHAGVAALGSYAYSRRVVSAGGSLRVASQDYTTVSLIAPHDRPAMDGGLFAGVSLGSRTSLTVQHGGARLHGGTSRVRTGMLAAMQMSRVATLTVSAAQTRDQQGRSREVFAGVTFLFGRSNTTFAAVRDAQGTRAIVDAHQPLPVGTGFGYQLHAENGATRTLMGVGRYQNRFGRYEVRHDAVGDTSHTTLTAMGSVVGIGGGLYASRPVQGGFAVLRVPGVEGVRGFASHQEVGRTNSSGNLLIPDLQPYYGNLLSIADGDVPFDYDIRKVGLTLAVPYRGGAVAVFPVHRVQRVVGTLRFVDDGTEHAPAYGELTVTTGQAALVSPVGVDGGFYFEDLPPGRHAAVATAGTATCVFTLEVPAARDGLVSVGLVRCPTNMPPRTQTAGALSPPEATLHTVADAGALPAANPAASEEAAVFEVTDAPVQHAASSPSEGAARPDATPRRRRRASVTFPAEGAAAVNGARFDSEIRMPSGGSGGPEAMPSVTAALAHGFPAAAQPPSSTRRPGWLGDVRWPSWWLLLLLALTVLRINRRWLRQHREPLAARGGGRDQILKRSSRTTHG